MTQPTSGQGQRHLLILYSRKSYAEKRNTSLLIHYYVSFFDQCNASADPKLPKQLTRKDQILYNTTARTQEITVAYRIENFLLNLYYVATDVGSLINPFNCYRLFYSMPEKNVADRFDVFI